LSRSGATGLDSHASTPASDATWSSSFKLPIQELLYAFYISLKGRPEPNAEQCTLPTYGNHPSLLGSSRIG
jgi:hypothetical protein